MKLDRHQMVTLRQQINKSRMGEERGPKQKYRRENWSGTLVIAHSSLEASKNS